MDNIDKNQLFSCLQKLSRSEFIDRRIRYQLIDKLDKVIFYLFILILIFLFKDV